MHRLPLRRGTLLVTFVGLTLLGVGIVSRYALLTVILEGIAAATIVVPAALGGLWLVPLLVRGAYLKPHAGLMPLRWHLLLGAALGLGTLSLLVLLLGLMGVLQRPIWIAILFVSTVAGVVRLRMLLRAGSASDPWHGPRSRVGWHGPRSRGHAERRLAPGRQERSGRGIVLVGLSNS